MKEKGRLYLVATPIGNLNEMTPRAVQVLKQVHTIGAEDTRVTGKLCHYFHIDTPLVSYHKYNEQEKSETLLSLLAAGHDLALVTDAGMPGISDPGELLVRKASALSIEVQAIGSGSALVHALVVSGLGAQPFTFLGFLPKEKGQKKKILEKYVYRPETLVLYVSPHALSEEIELCQQMLGNRQASLSREMTKWYEQTKRGSLCELHTWALAEKPKGEMVLVLEGGREKNTTEEAAQGLVRCLLDKGMSLRDACEVGAWHTGVRKRLLYNRAIEEKSSQE